MGGKRLSFWLGVAGVSILAQFGLELLADKVNSPALREFVSYSHKGSPTSANT